MKNLIILILFLFAALSINAQAYYLDTKSDVMAMENNTAKYRIHISDNHITSIKSFAYKGDDTVGYLSYQSKFDAKGNVVEQEQFKKNGKIKYHAIYKYDDNNRKTEVTWLKRKDKFNYKQVNTYDEAGNVINYSFYMKRPDNIMWHYIYKYDAKNNMIENTGYDYKNRLFDRTIYSYYDDGSKKQTTMYNDKGRVERVWNFDCNPIGKDVADKLKDTTQVCVKYETDKNGNKIKIKEENNVKGHHFFVFNRHLRTISKYDRNDNLLDLATYKMNGKEIRHWSNSYDDKNNFKEHIEYKPNTKDIKLRNVCVYDNSGNVIETMVYKKSDKPDVVYKLVYAK
jgi:hypothetical protein